MQCFGGVGMISRMDLLQSLAIENEKKMVLLVMDGLGGLPGEDGLTELEKAKTPLMDRLAAESELGLLSMVDVGITPGSGPGHLSLFGYDPLTWSIGRGILEALGVGAHVGAGDICARGNFCTVDADGVILDRRAGRIPSEESARVVEKLQKEIKSIENVKVTFYPGREHRFVVVFSGENLSEEVNDADPQKEGLPMRWAEARNEKALRTEKIINAFIRKVWEVLKDENPANGCLLRGFSSAPHIPSLKELYKIKPMALATYPMYRGLARLVGMEIGNAGETLEQLFDAVGNYWKDYSYFYVHVKYTDSRGEDGNFAEKVKIIEEVDRLLPKILDLKPDVLAITGDHSTPSFLSGHSWHEVPLLLWSPFARRCNAVEFGEKACSAGTLGRMQGDKLIGLMMAHGLKLNKYGA